MNAHINIFPFLQAIASGSETIQLSFPMSLGPEVPCQSFKSTMFKNTTIEALSGDVPPTLMIDFQRHNVRCVQVSIPTWKIGKSAGFNRYCAHHHPPVGCKREALPCFSSRLESAHYSISKQKNETTNGSIAW